jgi:hypothetical protein
MLNNNFRVILKTIIAIFFNKYEIDAAISAVFKFVSRNAIG